MARIPARLYLPLAIFLASVFSLLLFSLAAEPQLIEKRNRQAQLQSDLAARQQSLSLQKYQPVLDQLQSPLLTQRQIIKQIKLSADMKPKPQVHYNFNPRHTIQLENVSLRAQPLSLNITGLSIASVEDFITDFSHNMSNHTQLISWMNDGNSARLEFEIYGQQR